jgi:transcriptional regulator with XRE-family HTH domain
MINGDHGSASISVDTWFDVRNAWTLGQGEARRRLPGNRWFVPFRARRGSRYPGSFELALALLAVAAHEAASRARAYDDLSAAYMKTAVAIGRHLTGISHQATAGYVGVVALAVEVSATSVMSMWRTAPLAALGLATRASLIACPVVKDPGTRFLARELLKRLPRAKGLPSGVRKRVGRLAAVGTANQATYARVARDLVLCVLPERAEPGCHRHGDALLQVLSRWDAGGVPGALELASGQAMRDEEAQEQLRTDLRDLRLAAGMSQADVARRIGGTADAVADFERTGWALTAAQVGRWRYLCERRLRRTAEHRHQLRTIVMTSLRDYRERAGLLPLELAVRAGIDPKTVRAFESGEEGLDEAAIRRWRRACDEEMARVAQAARPAESAPVSAEDERRRSAYRNTVRRNLTALRNQVGLTQADIADATGVNVDDVARYELGDVNLSKPVLRIWRAACADRATAPSAHGGTPSHLPDAHVCDPAHEHCRLHALRVAAGFTIDDLAWRIGVSRTTILHYEDGHSSLARHDVESWRHLCGHQIDRAAGDLRPTSRRSPSQSRRSRLRTPSGRPPQDPAATRVSAPGKHTRSGSTPQAQHVRRLRVNAALTTAGAARLAGIDVSDLERFEQGLSTLDDQHIDSLIRLLGGDGERTLHGS